MEMYEQAIEFIVQAGAVSLPLVVACGLVGKAFGALVSMVTGERRVRL